MLGIAISSILNSGILDKAKLSIEETSKAEIFEEFKIKIYMVNINKNGNATLEDVVNYFKEDTEYEYIISSKQISSIKGDIPDISQVNEIYVIYKNYQFKIDNNLIITCIGYFNYNKNDNKAPEASIVLEKSDYLFGIKMAITLRDNESGLNYKKCKYIFTNSPDKVGIDEKLYTEGNFSKENTIVEKAKGPGDWYLHVLVTDNAGNSVEQVSSEKVTIESVSNYNYIGKEQMLALLPGKYKFECWGARGGSNYNENKNYGAYTSGIIELSKNMAFYVYVGEKGDTNRSIKYNGGAIGGKSNYMHSGIEGCSGGGATDIRTIAGNWSDFNSLKSRIMVAAGAGGATNPVYETAGQYSIAGGLNGYSGGYYRYHQYVGQEGGGATQTRGGIAGKNFYGASGTVNAGNFGIGGACESTSDASGAGGGGGGYYGGGAGGSTLTEGTGQGGGGGSSFISGHDGCDAIKEESTEDNIIHTGKSIHYSGLYFTNTIVIDGAGYNWTTTKQTYVGMPNYSGEIITGNTDNGYARITNQN